MQITEKIGELYFKEWLDWRDKVLEASNGLMESLENIARTRVTMMHASLDDVGQRKEDGMCAVVGYAANRERWARFNLRWMAILGSHGLTYLHTSEYLNLIPNVDGRPLSDADIVNTLQPFTNVINEEITNGNTNDGFGICVVTECAAYDALTNEEKTVIKKPEVHSFEMAVSLAANQVKDDLRGGSLMALQFDETKDAAKLYNSYKWLKEKNDTLREHLSGICFVDDKKHPPAQAADMLGNLTLKAWRRWKGGKDTPPAFRNLAFPDGIENKNVLVRIYNTEKLKSLATLRLERKASIIGA